MKQVVFIVSVLCVSAFSDGTYNIYQTAEKILADGYQSETHHVTTPDGYILEMHRIPHKIGAAQVSADRPVVFLMHGLMSASSAWVALGAQYGFAYHLVDAGFDVWMGNARGNKNSRHHVTLDPDDDLQKYLFFDFSFEEIGMIDLPAMMNYVLENTKKEQLHYIGHSQGGTVYLVMASMLPEFNKKIKSTHLLAGVGYMEYFPNEELAQLAAMSDMIYGLALQSGVVELYPPNSTEMFPSDLFPFTSTYRMADYCAGDLNLRYYCELIGIRHLLRGTEDIIDQPGAALKQIAHYGQNIRDKLFRRFHYGSQDNLGVYGADTPPAYDLSLISTHVTMHYTVDDILLDERDVLSMVADMPNAIARKVARDGFAHEDFVAALDAKELVTDYIIAAINNDGVPPPTEATPPPASSAPTIPVAPTTANEVAPTTANEAAQTTANEAAPTTANEVAPTEATQVAPNEVPPTEAAQVATSADDITTPAPGSAHMFSAMSCTYTILISLYVMLK